MEEKPPRLPDVWGGEEQPDIPAGPKQRTVPVKTVDLGPLGEFPQKMVILIVGAVVLLLVVLVVLYAMRPQKPVVLGSLDRAIAISPGGSRLLVGLNDGSVRIIDVASGKTLVFFGAFISCGAAASSTIVTPIRGFRSTLVSGGTLQATSAIAKFNTSDSTPVGELRTGNPTATLGAAIFASPPANNTNQLVTPVHPVVFPGGTGVFTLAAGEGVTLNASASDVDLRWNLGMIWGEI